jgi:hypothetical protein
MGIDDVRSSSLPEALKDWLYERLLRVDSQRPKEDFGKAFTQYLQQLPWTNITNGDGVLDQVWCRPGRTGILVLLVGLHWQADYSGGGKMWKENMKRVDTIFQAILNAPTL